MAVNCSFLLGLLFSASVVFASPRNLAPNGAATNFSEDPGTILHPVLTEFLADNKGGLRDEDGDSPDWLELFNPNSTSVNLGGWFLTDSTNQLTQWRFPIANLGANAYLVVFASSKNRTNTGLPLHTNFKLNADGGYLALVGPDGTNAVSEFRYAKQYENVSFGWGRAVVATPLVATGATARVLVPTINALGSLWTGANEPFDDSLWLRGPTGIGFDQSAGGGGGLLGFWNFNDANNPARAADSSGNNHQGTLAGGAVFTADAGGHTRQAGDRAINFGRVDSGAYVNIPDAAGGMFNSAVTHDAITLSLWVNGDSSEPGNGSVFYGSGNADGTGSRSLNAHLPWSDSVIYWDTGCCDSSLHRISVGEPDSTKWKGRWNHYAFVKKADTKQIWQNGALLGEGQNTENLATIRGFVIGAGANLNNWSYGGLIDDFAVWDVALTPAEIQALAAGALPSALSRFTSLLGTDLNVTMRGVNASAYVRVPFVVENPADLDLLLLRLRYDDGFVAYLNGTEVARRNAPDALAFDSAATVARPGGAALSAEEMDLSAFVNLLRAGTNVLAFHGLNRAATNENFLVLPELVAGQSLANSLFVTPTPGAPNNAGVDGIVDETRFSVDAGFFYGSFVAGISCATPGATIIYTTNGSEPSLSNGKQVPAMNANTPPSARVIISDTTVLRAATFKAGYQSSAIATHSYLFPGSVAAQKRPAGVGATWPSGQPADFGIDTRVVNSALPGYSFTDALLSIPTLTIVTPQDGLFGASGIYPNSGNRGDQWERAASVELIYPDGRIGFQENAGLAIHGNITRDKEFTPKHSFNVLFRGQYGATKLDFPIYPDSTVRKFDRLVLRAGSTDTWPCTEWTTFLVDGVQRWRRAEASYIRDQWSRDAHLAMGQPAGHGFYVHLFLNGLYWGLYNVSERPDADFAATYLGGTDDEYDVVADFLDVHAGNTDAWNQMMNLAGTGAVLSSDAAYQRIQGNNLNGTRNPNYPVLVDVTNLVDYMILHIYIGADDWPNHNWWAARRRGPESTGFKFFAWDQEISNSSLIRKHSSWGPIYAEADVASTPTFVYARCRANAEFRQLFADRVQLHLFNGGALTVSNNLARWDARIAEVDHAVVAESARWGDYQRPAQPFTREREFLSSNNWMRTVYWPSNHTIAIKRFRDVNLFPSLAAPILRQHGGAVPDAYSLSITNPNSAGTMYFTTDGSDPRLRGGALAPSALAYTDALTLTSPAFVNARVKNGALWSPLVQAQFFTPQDFTKFQLSEIYYNPPGAAGVDGDEFEFLEFKNTGTNTLDLNGLHFTAGINFFFTNGTVLAPSQFFVLVRNATVFASRFPTAPIHGVYSNKLDNAGETLTLAHALGATLLLLNYDSKPPWATGAAGFGPSLQRLNMLLDATNIMSWVAAIPTPGADLPAEFVDTDGDGLPDLWELAHDLNPQANDANDDPDHDRLTNLQEFIAGTNPRDPSSLLRIESLTLDGKGAVSVIEFTAVANRSYSVECRTSLSLGEWKPVASISPAPTTLTMQITNTFSNSEARFYRLVTPATPPN